MATVTLGRGTRLGAYEVVEPLGAGGMGEVYRARDTRLARDVAIKGFTVEVHQLELATGRRRLLRTLVIQDPAGASSPGRVRLTPDGASYAYSFNRTLSDLYLVEGLK